MDGNDSLRRIRRRILDDEDIPGPSCEHMDTRTIGGDFYLAREEVDKWVDEKIQELMVVQVRVVNFLSSNDLALIRLVTGRRRLQSLCR